MVYISEPLLLSGNAFYPTVFLDFWKRHTRCSRPQHELWKYTWWNVYLWGTKKHLTAEPFRRKQSLKYSPMFKNKIPGIDLQNKSAHQRDEGHSHGDSILSDILLQRHFSTSQEYWRYIQGFSLLLNYCRLVLLLNYWWENNDFDLHRCHSKHSQACQWVLLYIKFEKVSLVFFLQWKVASSF